MRAGQLRYRVEILRRMKGKDEAGATISEWRPSAVVWADVRHLSGTETLRHDVLTASARASVRIRWRSDVSAEMRLRVGGTLYAVRSVIPDFTRREFLDLVCESLPDGSED